MVRRRVSQAPQSDTACRHIHRTLACYTKETQIRPRHRTSHAHFLRKLPPVAYQTEYVQTAATAAHPYRLDDFGLSEEVVDETFSAYRKQHAIAFQ